MKFYLNKLKVCNKWQYAHLFTPIFLWHEFIIQMIIVFRYLLNSEQLSKLIFNGEKRFISTLKKTHHNLVMKSFYLVWHFKFNHLQKSFIIFRFLLILDFVIGLVEMPQKLYVDEKQCNLNHQYLCLCS